MDLSSAQNLVLDSRDIRRLDGFGMTVAADAYVATPRDPDEILAVFDLAKRVQRQVVLRGAGRSYGDASLLPEAIAIDLSQMTSVLGWDAQTGIIDVQAGATIETLWRTALPDGWWPPVVSGTMFPTLGGALGMNIHGKNAYKVGPIGQHVLDFEVVTPTGAILTLTSSDPLFHQVISSAGTLGVITRVRLQMKKVASGNVSVYAASAKNWDEQFALFESKTADSDYAVSWIDAFASGSESGRGLFHSANYAPGEPSTLSLENQDLPTKIMGVVPKSEVWRVLRILNNHAGMKTLNAIKHQAGRRLEHGTTHTQSLVAFSFLLDYVPNWRRSYSPGGFIQYQSFVPKEHAKRVFAQQVAWQQEHGLEAYLAVMKRHVPDGFLLSHGVDGYSLAFDFKVTTANWSQVQQLAHRMNDLVIEAGGRFYFAKDSTLRPSDVQSVWPEALATLRRAKTELDPESILSSSLANRLQLF